MPEYLFVYGTLRPGMAPRRLAHLMKKMRYMGRASTPGRLYDLDAYPGAVLDPDCDTEIKGEVFQLPDDGETLAAPAPSAAVTCIWTSRWTPMKASTPDTLLRAFLCAADAESRLKTTQNSCVGFTFIIGKFRRRG